MAKTTWKTIFEAGAVIAILVIISAFAISYFNLEKLSLLRMFIANTAILSLCVIVIFITAIWKLKDEIFEKLK